MHLASRPFKCSIFAVKKWQEAEALWAKLVETGAWLARDSTEAELAEALVETAYSASLCSVMDLGAVMSHSNALRPFRKPKARPSCASDTEVAAEASCSNTPSLMLTSIC